MPRVPDRSLDPEWEDADVNLSSVGNASMSLYEREVTAAEKKKWRKEDAERDKRRIKPGFRL